MAENTPNPGERTGPQGPAGPHAGYPATPAFLETQSTMLGGALYANGGTLCNPMAFPGYGHLYTGSYLTYRWMLQHPILRLVRAISTAIVISSTWEYVAIEEGDKIPTRWLKLIKSCFGMLRPQLISDFYVRGRDMGWVGGEPIWTYNRRRQLIISRVKPLLHEVTEVLTDRHGNITGLRNNVGLRPQDNEGRAVADAGRGFVDLDARYKAFVYTYDREYDNHYGRSWLENVRATAWKDWLDCAQQLQKLGNKITGIVSVITSPAGTFPGPPGPDGKPTQISYKSNAEAVIKALANGAAGVWFPTLGLTTDARGNVDAMKVLVELANKSLTNINVLDFGTQAAALAPILERMIHAEELMFAGGLRPARTGLEGKFGTKAEAGVFTDTGTYVAEAEDEDFARQCQPLVDMLLAVNYGEQARGRVRIKPPSLVDRKASVVRAVLLAMLNNQDVNTEMAATIDVDALLKTLDIDTKKPFDADAVLKLVQDKLKKPEPGPDADPNKTPEPEGGRPRKENSDAE